MKHGPVRLVTFSETHLEQCHALCVQYSTSTELDLKKSFIVAFEKAMRECVQRKHAIGEKQCLALDDHADKVFRDLGRYDLMLGAPCEVHEH